MREGSIRGIVRLLVASILTGLVAAAFAVLYRLALARGLALLLGTDDVLVGFAGLTWLPRLLLPATGALLAGAIGVVTVRGGGHGMADVMEAVTLGRGHLSLRLVLAKSVASYAALVTGGSLGREGSMLQFGAALGDALGERFALPPRRRRALLAAGTAAGFAAAYNTPIAAIVFVVEVVTGLVELELLLPVIVATTIATVVTRAVSGGMPLYGQRSFALASQGELVAHAALGVLAGLVGPLFLNLLFATEARVGVTGWLRPLVAAAGGLAVGAVALGFPEVAGNGFEAIQRTLSGTLAGPILLTLVCAKVVATVASVSTGSPGGVFTPSMFLGAALGGAFGSLLAPVFPSIGPSGGYALVGMAAMLAATTHAPLMAATLAFELSGDYAIVLPLLLATGLGAFVSRTLRQDSVYTEELRRRGIPWHGSLSQRLAHAVHARDLLELAVASVDPGAPLDDVLRLLDEGARAVYVPGDPMKVISCDTARGFLAARARGGSVPATAGEAALRIDTAAPDDDLLSLSEKLWRLDQGQIPVVDRTSGALLGVVTRRDVLGAIDREVLDRDVLVTRIVRYEASGASADYLELPAGWLVETVPAPRGLVDREVDSGGLRQRLGVLVVGVRLRGRGGLVDVAGRTLRANDHLVVMGSRSALDGLRAC